MDEQSLPDSQTPLRRRDIDIFQPDAVMAAPSRVAVEEQGKARRLAFMLRDNAAKVRYRTKTIAQEIFFGGEDAVRFALVKGEFADVGKDLRDVSR